MSEEYLVDLILPAHEVHLVAGPSGAGKSRWLFENLLLWEKGEDFLGFKSHPVPWVYVAGDRSIKSVNRTLADMGMSHANIKCIPAWDKHMGVNEILDNIKASGAGMAVWESFGSLVEAPGTGKQVKALIQRCSHICQQDDITIMAVVESPKMKPAEKYENPRQRVSGAAAWGHFTETIFLVEPDCVGDPDNPYRTLYVCPRNAPGSKIQLCFTPQGRLLPVEEPSVEEVIKKFKKRR